MRLMNEKSKQIGMNNTLFRNPSGLDENDGNIVWFSTSKLLNVGFKNSSSNTN